MGHVRSFKLVLILLCVLLIPGLTFVARGSDLPSPTSAFYVNDYADVIDFDTEQYIAKAAASLESKTTAQLVVVTVDDIADQTFEYYSLDLFRKWGIGSKDKNNGVLILVDLGGKRSRIEVGYGLEGALPDGKTGRIQDEYMIPYFKNNDYDEGIRQGFNALLGEIYNEYGIDVNSISDIEAPVKDKEGLTITPYLYIIGIILIVILVSIDIRFTGGIITISILRILFRGGRGGGGGGLGGGGGGGRGSRGGGGSGGGGGSSRSW